MFNKKKRLIVSLREEIKLLREAMDRIQKEHNSRVYFLQQDIEALKKRLT